MKENIRESRYGAAGSGPAGELSAAGAWPDAETVECAPFPQDGEHFRYLLCHGPDLVLVLEGDLKVRWVSPSSGRITGYREEELCSRDILSFLHPEDREKAMQAIYFCATHFGVPYLLEVRFRHRDGTYRHHQARVTNLLQDPVVHGVIVNSRDISEQVKVEEALHESEERLRVLSEHSMLGIVILQDNRFRYMNRAAADIYGLSPEGYQDLDVMETINAVIHPEDRDFIIDQARRKQRDEGGQVASYAFRVVTRTGETRWLEIYSKTVSNRGRPAALVTIADITDRKLAEEALREKEEYFRSLIENSLDVVLIVDESNRVKYVTPSVERIFGYRPEELMGKWGMGFIPQDELIRAAGEFAKVLQDPDNVYEGEFHARHKDGSWRTVLARGCNMFAHPLVRGIVVNLQDVTERKAIERRLQDINRLFLGLGADIIANMEAIVQACRDLLGAPFAAYYRLEMGRFSVLSTDPGEEGLLVTGEDRNYLALKVIKEGEDEPLIIKDLRANPDDARDPLARKHDMASFLGYPVRVKGRTVGCLCLYYPEARRFLYHEVETVGLLTRALAGEEERLANEQNLKNFVDVAAHELRHPVTVMKGYALTLRDYGERLDEGTRREYLELISKGADRLDDLIRELLDASRIERGRFAVNREEQRLEPLLERAVREVREKGIAHPLRLAVKRELAPRKVDADKLVQVLVILLDNAVAHSPAHFPVEVEAEERDGEALISVLDRGVGIPEAQRELIFERFYQVEDAAHETSRGMGLGLYIAREIVEAHGGRIWHEPRLGGGSIFRFILR